jgi:hypothetical protein
MFERRRRRGGPRRLIRFRRVGFTYILRGATMLRTFFFIVFLFGSIGTCTGGGQTAPTVPQELASFCSLQQKVGTGEHETVLVSGIYGASVDMGVLVDSACPTGATWVELKLRTVENRRKLSKILAHSRRAKVIFEGEFYGPPQPDPNLPESLRESYHPGWGHLAAFRTKLVVSAIQKVDPAPPDTHPVGSFVRQPSTH